MPPSARRLSEPLPLPAPGEKPLAWEPASPLFDQERVLHFHLGLPNDAQPSLVRAVQSLTGTQDPWHYRKVDWLSLGVAAARARLVGAAYEIKPTLVFLQVQKPGILEPHHLVSLRQACADEAVIVWWSGDAANANGLLAWRDWMPPLMEHLDLVLFSNLSVPRDMQAAGFERAGYLQVGFDSEYFFPAPAPTRIQPLEYDLVFFARRYPRGLDLDKLGTPTDVTMRHEAMTRFSQVPGLRFLWGHRASSQETGEVYRKSRMALSISMTSHYERCSSDRLFRILATGCVPIVKRFLRCEDLGLEHGKNCLLFDTLDEAEQLVRKPPPLDPISAGALALAQEHTWDQRMRELRPLVHWVRKKRSFQ